MQKKDKMILGYIVTHRKLNNIDNFVGQVHKISDACPTKPILIVGWEEAKKHPNYKNILEKQLSDNVFWTFSKTESRSNFEQDLQKFYNYIYNILLNNIYYKYINIFNINYSNIKNIYNYLFNKEKKIIYINNNILYFPFRKKIYGISLQVCEYCHISKEKIINKIRLNPNNIIIDEDSLSILHLKQKLHGKFFAIPYVYQYC